MRLHDNPALSWALSRKATEVLPVYTFDPRFFTAKVEQYGSLKCGLVRAMFILETVTNLRSRLESLGSRLLVTMEKPETFIPRLCDSEGQCSLVYQQEICQ